MALMLTSLVGRLKREHAGAAGDAEEIVALVNRAIDGARALARGVSPVSVERGGLPSALRALASHASDMYGAAVRFRGKVWPQLTLDAAACDHLYRIAQEAVNNAVKHGRASQVTIDLQVTTENVTLIGARQRQRHGTRCAAQPRHGSEDHALPRQHDFRRRSSRSCGGRRFTGDLQMPAVAACRRQCCS